MAQMNDTEGSPLPPGNDGRAVFDIALMGGSQGESAWLALDVPMAFTVESDAGQVHGYSSAGVLRVDLRAVLQEYLDLDHASEDGEESLKAVEALLREFANKIADKQAAA